MTKEDSQYLYHYTTLDAFVSIVEKQELWASNIFYLNDSAEFHLAITLARELLEGDISNEIDVQKRQELETFLGLLSEVTPGVTTEPYCFVCSFSEEKDDLSQWRAYCSNGGVAVGFHCSDLRSLTANQDLGFAPRLEPCIYEEHEQREEVRACVSRALDTMPGERIGASMSPEEIKQFKAGLLQYILVEKPIKSKDFAGEKEWRLIASLGGEIRQEERLGFRSRNGLVIPYWKINLDPGGDKEIWENVRVTVGPSPHPRELEASIEGLLIRHCGRHPSRVSEQVESSKVTYRYW